MARRNSDLMTSTTTVATLPNGRKEKQHVCDETGKVSHAISAHDEQGICHADDCKCPGYEPDKGAAPIDEGGPIDPRDAVDTAPAAPAKDTAPAAPAKDTAPAN